MSASNILNITATVQTTFDQPLVITLGNVRTIFVQNMCEPFRMQQEAW